MRKLAEESQQAAATIASLIQEIQHDTSHAVEVVDRGAAQTEEGVATVERAREAFVRIGGSVDDDMSARIDQISSAVEQISASSQRMQDSMSDVASVAEESSASSEQVSASTEHTTASTQQIAAAAHELADTADKLSRLVGQFRLASA